MGSVSRPGNPRPGREALLDAAAVLMDEHGVDHASLNEINRFAGQHNRSAVQYHFGTREALIRELVQRTMRRIDAERAALLDHLEATRGTLTPREAVEVVIGPMARRLSTAEGRRHLRLVGQLLNHPHYNADARDNLQLAGSLARCAAFIAPIFGDLPAEIRIERVSQGIAFVVRAIADQARLLDAHPPSRPVLDQDRFVANLVDVLTAMLGAPSSKP